MSKRIPTILFQTIVIIIGIAAFAALIWLPSTEGRAANLDLFSIYSDPFVLFGYTTSVAFFIGLYKTFKLLGYIGQNKTYSQNSVKAVKSIKYCAITFTILILLAELFIMLTHNKEDDSAGFLTICTATSVIAVAIAIIAKKFEKRLSTKSEHETRIDS